MKIAIMSNIHCNYKVFTRLINDALQNDIALFFRRLYYRWLSGKCDY